MQPHPFEFRHACARRWSVVTTRQNQDRTIRVTTPVRPFLLAIAPLLLDDLLDRSRVADLPHGAQRGPQQLLVRRDRDRATHARKLPHLASADRSLAEM